MITLKVYPNTFLSYTEKYNIQVTNTDNSKGNFLVLFPFICNLLSNLMFNLLETIRW
ncbi:hypothetical protein KQI88_00410 [Alkaliphilus sp. MSJ-5]|uniref:Uncharacterized protein n=1 Tax=Alkaliphilus flagellatus TaxID=2841507 RepID=A0ABS6FY96_9FIRM|nr:hypothetical protein [Alkaliphilus flagellatus]MBU5674876.1 hypothetical protein [Alkaliphilus flagellatus]